MCDVRRVMCDVRLQQVIVCNEIPGLYYLVGDVEYVGREKGRWKRLGN